MWLHIIIIFLEYVKVFNLRVVLLGLSHPTYDVGRCGSDRT